MGDILDRTDYYTTLKDTFEDLREKRAAADADVREEFAEKQRIEKELEDLQSQLQQCLTTRKSLGKELKTTESLLNALQAGGLAAKVAMRRLQQGTGGSVQERAEGMRNALREEVLGERPDSPHREMKVGLSAEFHHEAVAVEDHFMTREDGEQTKLRVFSGAASASLSASTALATKAAVIVYFHGQLYVTGDLDTHDWLCRSLAALSGVTVAAVELRRAPEEKWPVPFEDAWQALCWVANCGLGFEPRSLCVAGDSSGGGLAASCCIHARDKLRAGEEAPEVHLQVLFYPWLDLRPDSSALQELSMQQDDLDFCRELYSPPPATPPDEDMEPEHPKGANGLPWFDDPRASPLAAESLEGLPSAFVAYAQDDALAGESVEFARRMREDCGAEAVHTLFLPGPLGHGYVKMADQPAAHTTLSAAAAFIAGALKGR